MIGWLRIAPRRHSLIAYGRCACSLPDGDASEITALGVCTDCGSHVIRISAQIETTANASVWTVDAGRAGQWDTIATGRARTVAAAKRSAEAAVELILRTESAQMR